jgi:hypothetical protein
MDSRVLLFNLLKEVTDAIQLKRRRVVSRLHREAVRKLNQKQADATEKDLNTVLVPLIEKQVNQAVSKIASGSKKNLVDKKQATKELKNAVAPVLILRMAEASRNQLLAVGLDLRKRRKAVSSTKTTTATEWLMEQDMDDLLDGMPSLFPSNMPFGIVTELPKPYRKKIVSSLRESFKQPYWDDIAATTEGDVNRILERGLQEGRSIQDMAKDIRESLGEEYYKNRAFNIARTESCGSQNAARRDAMDQLAEDLGGKVPMRPVWLSVLGNTTRDTHAALDGVPADSDGLWDLAGYMIPYPGHHSLPPEEKCQCRCSIFTEFGLQEEEANQLIQDYEERSNDGDE